MSSVTLATIETIGQQRSKIPVQLSTRFLEHFSEQLYSSPQKAFEELVSNGWDAGADSVDIRISPDLSKPGATMSVLDNGKSMDAEGLKQLWRIAYSSKTEQPVAFGRKVIGKFGIGKLATYVLAKKLTYICKSSDGIIRRVTMDYGEIDRHQTTSEDRLINDLNLDLFEVSEEDVQRALRQVYAGDKLLASIKAGVPKPDAKLSQDEFGAPPSDLKSPPRGSWTLVILSDLKPAGKDLRIGILRRMLQAALPFGTEMAISLNEDLLVSSKIDAPVMKEWTIGPDLRIDNIEIDENDDEDDAVGLDDESSAQKKAEKRSLTKVLVKSSSNPYPHVEIDGIGPITGRVRLFEDQISFGKSEDRGASNGFHVNVLGRVINQNDPAFGETNLSHAAWARFRMAVRADGLNELLTTDREKLRERRELKIFRAFLRKAFNISRNYYDNDTIIGMPDEGDILVRSLGVLSLNPLRNVVSESLQNQPPIPGLFDEDGIEDRSKKREEWRSNTADNIKSALDQVKFERSDDDSFVKFRLIDNTIVVNKDHPFVAEHSRSRAEKELLRTMAMVSLLSDVYALDIGVSPAALENIRDYRDKLMRFRAIQTRRSGTYIAKLLLEMQHDSSNSKRLEAVLSDALRYLGFQVSDLAKPGEPEGIASAYAIPSNRQPTREDPNPPLYKFSFDAKSSKHEVAATGNIKLDGIVEHRERFKANYALVVAPGYSDGALAIRCSQQRVTPMEARDLGRLLEYTVEHGAIPLTKLREIFSFHDPAELTAWVDELESWLVEKRPLTIDIFLAALDNLKMEVPDALPAAMISRECRKNLEAYSVQDVDVIAIAKGLAILVPDLVGVEQDKIIVNASAARVGAAVAAQLDRLRDENVRTADLDSAGK